MFNEYTSDKLEFLRFLMLSMKIHEKFDLMYKQDHILHLINLKLRLRSTNLDKTGKPCLKLVQPTNLFRSFVVY